MGSMRVADSVLEVRREKVWMRIDDEEDVNRLLKNALKDSCEMLLSAGHTSCVAHARDGARMAVDALEGAFQDLISHDYVHTPWMKEMRTYVFGEGPESDEFDDEFF
jgi:hypothetical protein